jgi:hypothetical protein
MNYTDIFNKYAKVWKFNDFWKRASTAEAALHFISAVGDNESRTMMRNMLAKNVEYYYHDDHASAWADDYGWWGLLGVRAYTYLTQHRDFKLADDYKQLARDAWKKMLKMGYDYANSSHSSYPVPHGCANNNIFGETGAKNTVTNALLLLLSIRLYNTFKESDYLVMAEAQWVWFRSWFELEQFHYLHIIHNNSGKAAPGAALVLERPLGGNYTNIDHPDWEEGLLWSGDQGLILAALVELPNTSATRRISEYLGHGIREALIGPDLVFREAPFFRNYRGEFAEDYFAGRGIMIRNLNCQTVRHFQLEAPINATIRAILNNPLMENITSSPNDLVYVNRFRSLWGRCDNVTEWDATWRSAAERDAIIQALEMDFLAVGVECEILR